MGFFKTRLVDDAVVEWQLDEFTFLIDNLSSGAGLPDGELWQPTSEHFGYAEGQDLTGNELAHFTFGRILEQCRMPPDFPVQLLTVETAPTGFLTDTVVLQSDKRACGLYRAEKDSEGNWQESITIDFELTEKPTNLVATLAHELAHALHNRMPEPYEGEPELYELFTDLTAVYFGYGLFLANSRFEFSSGDMGWQAQGAGYLPETDLVFATALFMRLKNIEPVIAEEHLKPRLVGMLKKAFKQLERYEDDIEELRLRVPSRLS